MYKKVLSAAKHFDFDPLRIAKQMGITVLGRTMVFGNEIEQDALANYHFNEYRMNGKTLAQSVDSATAGLTPLEAEVLEAARQSHSSFYQVSAFVPEEKQIRLRDLLDSQAPEVLLTDVGLSQSLAINGMRFALFCRPARVRGIAMTNGTSFAFHLENAPGLLQAYRQKTRKVLSEHLSEHRFIFFFQKHRQIGIEQVIRDWT
jgi:hypothetical protein